MSTQYAKDLKQQIMDNEYRRREIKKEAAGHMESCYQRSSEDLDRAADEKYSEARACYSDNVQQELINTRNEKQFQYESDLSDKKRADYNIQAIYDDNLSEQLLKEDNIERQRADMETYKLAKNSRLEEQKIMNIAEDKQIKKHDGIMQYRSSNETEDRASKQATREAHSIEIGEKNLKDKMAKEDHNNIMSLKQQNEYIEKDLQDEIANKLKVQTSSDELMIGLDAQVSDHKAEAVKQKMEEYAFYEQMMTAVEAAKLQEEEDANKIKVINETYRAELLQQIEDNKKRREEERRRNM